MGGDVVKCILCPHYCILSDSQFGRCGVRQNIKGELYSLSYGNIVAMNIDPVEKKPLYHFLPGSKTLSIASPGCNFSCKNCQNSDISQSTFKDIKKYLTKVTPEQIINIAKINFCESISFTYTEPTVFFEFMLETAKLAYENGIKNIMVSNGYINKGPLEEIVPFLNAANIDVKCFSNKMYMELAGAKLGPVLNTLKTLFKHNIWIEITNLIIPGWSDNDRFVLELCDWLNYNGFQDVPLHFSSFFPAYKMTDVPPTSEERIYEFVNMAKQKGIKYVYPGNVRKNVFTNCYFCNSELIKRFNNNMERNDFPGICPDCNAVIKGIWK